MKTEIKHQVLNLEDLQTFQQSGVPLGPKLGEKLESTHAHIVCFVQQEESAAATMYSQIIDRTSNNFSIVIGDKPISKASDITKEQVIPLVINSAINPELKEMMFQNDNFGELLADRFPVLNPLNKEATPILHCVGITRHGIKILTEKENNSNQIQNKESLSDKRSERIRSALGDLVTPMDFRRILRSNLVKEINLHALGPAGTNISQAAHLFTEKVRIHDKTNIIIHGSGITPLEYAEMATEETQKLLRVEQLPHTLHLHMECAVFDGMWQLYQQRAEESVFIDEQNMALDSMQLAAQVSIDELRSKAIREGRIRIVTHPSPKPLLLPWINQGFVKWVEASSNSAAALMVTQGRADACITTASAVTLLAEQNMHTLHQFGSPNMIFTIASPLSHRHLCKYLERIK